MMPPSATPAAGQAGRHAGSRGYGLALFASILLFVLGCFNMIQGIAAIANSHVFTPHAHYVFANLQTWGWVTAVLGGLQFVAAAGVLAANQRAGQIFVETARTHDKERNALCPANPYPSAAEDWIRTTLIAQQAQAAWSAPDISGWLNRSRLDAARGIGDHATDSRMQASLHRLFASMKPAIDNLAHLA
jgi:hypothetical protein